MKIKKLFGLVSNYKHYCAWYFIIRSKHLFIENYKYKDIRIVASAVAKFKDATQNKKLKISQITPSVMETYKTYLIHDAKLSGETAHNYFTRFKKVLRNAKIKGYIKSMPTDEIRFKNPNKEDTLRKQVLTPEELQLLV